jgi:hypothetical protein
LQFVVAEDEGWEAEWSDLQQAASDR